MVTDVVKEAGQESLPLLADPVLDALFSDAVRTRVLQVSEDGLRQLIDSMLGAIPASASNGQLRRELDRAETQLRTMLEEAIDSVFSGSARAEFERHMEEAARQIPEGDSDAAKEQAGQAV